MMVLQNISEIEEGRDNEKAEGVDSGHDENDELMLISNTPDSDDEDQDVDMYSSSSDD